MNILYIGDVMGKAGRDIVDQLLPALKKQLKADFVIAQAENSDDYGKGPRPKDIQQMHEAGVNFFSGGNHSFSNPDTNLLYQNSNSKLIRPANAYDKPGVGHMIVEFQNQKILIVSILGQTVGSQKFEITNPLKTIDDILEKEQGNYDISVVNFHGDFSSEKRVFGYYLDGRASIVVGDHWHVPTADAMIFPGGTAHITDVGMCGALHSSLGVKTSVIIDRWKSGKPGKNEMEVNGPYQFNALLVDVDESTGFAKSVEHINRIIE